MPGFHAEPVGKAPCRSAERRRCSNGYKFAFGKLAKTTAKAQVIASSLCELVAPRCEAGGCPHSKSVFYFHGPQTSCMAMERGTLFFVRPMLPKGGGGIPAVPN